MSRWSLRLTAPLMVVLSAGCPFVSRGDLEAQLEERDDDGDGVSVAAGDCDDTNPDVFPGAIEVPYDGIDNDCDEGDLVDVDQDGFDMGPDCDDDDPDVRPDAPDVPHDGVDSDCRGDHDFDIDKDGWTVAGVDTSVIEAYEAANELPAGMRGDCDDFDRKTSPGETEDPFYDGKDSDCDGAHDFDQDGDGFVLPDQVNGSSPAFDRYIAEQGLPDVPMSEWDCNDLDDSIYPGAIDEWHDGIDTNCDGADDFDADLDGVPFPLDCFDVPDAAQPDLDPADAYPGALELLDGEDQDCGGDGDQAVWRDDGLVFEGARSLRIAHVNGRFIVGLLADEFTIPPTFPQFNGFLLLGFDDQGGADVSATETAFQVAPGDRLSDSLQLSVNAGVFQVGLSVPNPGTVSTFQHLYDFPDAGVGVLSAVPQSLATTGEARESVALDLTAGWGWSCGDGALFAADRVGLNMVSTLVPGTIDTCFAETGEGVGTVCAGGACRTFDATSGSLVEVPGPRNSQVIQAARRHGGLWTFVIDGEVSIEGANGPTVSARHADAAARGGDVYVLVEDGGLALLHGPDGGPFESVSLTPGVGEVVDVAVAVSSSRVFAAVLTDMDGLHWTTWAR